MRWFGIFSLTWWPGTIAFLVLGCVLIMRWMRYTKGVQPASSYPELFAHVKGFFGPTDAYGFGSTRRLALLALGLGLTSMASVMAGDSLDNQPCMQACKNAGWDNGRLRGSNPHAPTESAPGCWCYSGEKWSPAAVDEGSLQPDG